MADGFGGCGKAGAESGEIQRAGTFVDLHGVAAAHGDVGLGFAVEVGEFASSATPAVRISRNFDGLEASGPDIGGDEAAMERVFFSG